MNMVIRILNAIIWLALAIGVGESFANLNDEIRGAAIQAHQRGPLSYKLFTEQLTGQK